MRAQKDVLNKTRSTTFDNTSGINRVGRQLNKAPPANTVVFLAAYLVSGALVAPRGCRRLRRPASRRAKA